MEVRKVGLRVAEVATIMDVSEYQVRVLISDDELPHVRIGKHIRVHPDAVVAYLRQGLDSAA